MPADNQQARFVLTKTTLPGFEGYPYWIPAGDEVAPVAPKNTNDSWAVLSGNAPAQTVQVPQGAGPVPETDPGVLARFAASQPVDDPDVLARFWNSQPALWNMADPWSVYPDHPQAQAPINAGDPFAIFPGNQSTFGNGSDPWSAFPDWSSAGWYARDPWAFPDASFASSDTRASFAVPTLSAQTWASASGPFTINPPASGNANDPSSVFPDWPPAGMQQQNRAAGPTGALSAMNFNAPVRNNAVNTPNLPASVPAALASGGNVSGTNAPYGPLQTGLNALGYAFQHSVDPELADAENVRYLVENYPELAEISGGVGLAALAAFALPEILGGGAVSTAARTAMLRKAIPAAQKGRITMAVGLAEDANGTRQVLISTSERRFRKSVEQMRGEIPLRGTGHAEADIVNFARQNGLKLLEIGATRPICPSCASLIKRVGAKIVTPLKVP